MTTDLERHELSALLTDMPEAEYQDLIQSISNNGQREPIRVFDGKVIDGWHRYRAAMDAGVQPWIEDYDEEEHGDIQSFVIDQNVRRRHLSAQERARIEVAVREWRPDGVRSTDDSESFTNAQMAAEAGVSERTIGRAKAEKRAKDAPPPVASDFDEAYDDEDDAPDTPSVAAEAPAPEPRMTPTERLEAEVDSLRKDLLAVTNERDDLRNENSVLRRGTDSGDWEPEFDRINENYMAERAQREALQERVNELTTRNQVQEEFVRGLRALARNNDCATLQSRLLD